MLIDHSVKGIAWSAASHIKSKLLKLCWCLIGRFLTKEVETHHGMAAEQERMDLNSHPEGGWRNGFVIANALIASALNVLPNVFSAVGTPFS